MATNGTVLCIHRDPTQLGVLQEHGYDVVTATNGSDGLRLFMSQPVDAIVLEYHLGLLDGSTIADTIKKVHPDIPVVMLTDHLELPDGALKSVDALVTKSDGAHFLWATVHFVLNVKPAQRLEEKLRPQMPVHLRPHSRQRAVSAQLQANLPELAPDSNDTPFSPTLWRSIQDGDVQF
jgi:DNA-binding response OmpR family regulator